MTFFDDRVQQRLKSIETLSAKLLTFIEQFQVKFHSLFIQGKPGLSRSFKRVICKEDRAGFVELYDPTGFGLSSLAEN